MSIWMADHRKLYLQEPLEPTLMSKSDVIPYRLVNTTQKEGIVIQVNVLRCSTSEQRVSISMETDKLK